MIGREDRREDDDVTELREEIGQRAGFPEPWSLIRCCLDSSFVVAASSNDRVTASLYFQ
jgi:hypothetical protein